jgi:putative DNA primase/helicase
VVAYARNTDNEGWGKLLRFRDPDGKPHDWVMPEEMLAGESSELCRQLMRRGLRICPSKGAAEFLREYLQRFQPDLRARTVERIGWSDETCTTFVLPDEQTITIPPNGAEMILLKPMRGHSLKTSGTLEEWKHNISRYCSGNSRLLFAMSCAAAAPLLPFFNEASGGFHFYGPTSVGKTILLTVAGSFWGGGGQNGFVQHWHTTANAPGERGRVVGPSGGYSI